MDRLTRAFFEMQFKLAFFLENRGESFQDLFSGMMSKRYPGDFIPIRPWGKDGDRKNDGYLPSKRVLFQCYAPNELSKKKCVQKMEEDFSEALPHWEEFFDQWTFVHNTNALPPHAVEKLAELDQRHVRISAKHWGYDELRGETFQLGEADLAALLGPAPTQQGMLAVGVEDLEPVLKQIVQHPPAASPDLRPVPPGKLERNLLSDDAAALLKAGMTRSEVLSRYFRLRPLERDRIAEAFSRRYQQLRDAKLAPDEILMSLHRFAAGDAAVKTPAVQNAIFTVLAYFFEECDIFERVQEET